ncbi:hypothetical protein NDU88_000796 [Pleurodeles waltl]|uniref:Uncharacterized protein n=1 Tax=Pleurodeles waltl TaxID=8319 RepID=A0AAV7UR00_PLEWA|nr:hypothetical protein NDU88_000796 [Pleurodeles waltl]
MLCKSRNHCKSNLDLEDLQEPATTPVEVETVQQGYDAELQLAVAALQQILQVQDGPCTMSQDSAFAGVPEGEATLNLDKSFKNTVLKSPKRLRTAHLLRRDHHVGKPQSHPTRAPKAPAIRLNCQGRL